MRLSAVVPVKNAAARLPRLLRQLAALSDELVVLVDRTSSDESESIARSFTTAVYPVGFDPQFSEIHRQVIERCTGDWILMIDDDEILSPAWTRDVLCRLMADHSITHYWIPRRWLVGDGERFLCNAPWFPDFQLRLLRNMPAIIQPPGEMHVPYAIAGEASYLTDLHIYHLNLLAYSRADREEKVRRSIRANPKKSCREFYLYEDFYHQAAHFLDAPDHGFTVKIAGELGCSAYCVDTFVSAIPEKLVAGQQYAIEIQLTNRSTRELRPELPYALPRNFSYSHHMYRKRAHGFEVYTYGESRWPLATTIPIGGVQRALVDVRMPAEPGEYFIAFDFVEEFKAWFSEADPSGYREQRTITVSLP